MHGGGKPSGFAFDLPVRSGRNCRASTTSTSCRSRSSARTCSTAGEGDRSTATDGTMKTEEQSLHGSGRKPAIELALATFAILVLELAMIRWLTTQIRIAANFAYLVLLAAFLGMGLGVGLGRHRARLARWSVPALAVVCVLLACARPLGLVHVRFPDLPTESNFEPGPTWPH